MTVIADPVVRCALSTVAEDTVQFAAAVTDPRVAHLVRGGNEARKIVDPENRRPAINPLARPVAITTAAASRVNRRLVTRARAAKQAGDAHQKRLAVTLRPSLRRSPA